MRQVLRIVRASAALLFLCGLPTSVPAATPVVINGAFTFEHQPPAGTTILLVEGAFQGESNPGDFTGPGTFLFSTVTFSYSGTFQWDFGGGNTIQGTLSGQDYPVTTPNGYPTTMTLNVSGGTGRFAGARGAILAQGLDDFNPQETSTVTAEFTGLLLLP